MKNIDIITDYDNVLLIVILICIMKCLYICRVRCISMIIRREEDFNDGVG